MIVFEVLGVPKAKGDLTFWGLSKKGKPIIANRNTGGRGEWRSDVRASAESAMKGRLPLEGPVSVFANFTMPIPKTLDKKLSQGKVSRYTSKRNGDIDKLLRCVFDSMNGIVFQDDAQVAMVKSTKIYGHAPGVWIEVEEIT